jgi:probable rRNA maturation factor
MSATLKLSLAVQYATNADGLPTRQQFRRWIKAALQRDVQIALRIVDETEGRELNRNFRGKDYATNVLTFVYDDTVPTPDVTTSHSTKLSKDDSKVAGYPKLPNPSQPPLVRGGEGEEPVCGDVVICAAVVEQEAREQHKDLSAHYAHLAIHAALHLQGFDHEKEKDAVAMEALETAIMLKLGYADPYQVVTA